MPSQSMPSQSQEIFPTLFQTGRFRNQKPSIAEFCTLFQTTCLCNKIVESWSTFSDKSQPLLETFKPTCKEENIGNEGVVLLGACHLSGLPSAIILFCFPNVAWNAAVVFLRTTMVLCNTCHTGGSWGRLNRCCLLSAAFQLIPMVPIAHGSRKDGIALLHWLGKGHQLIFLCDAAVAALLCSFWTGSMATGVMAARQSWAQTFQVECKKNTVSIDWWTIYTVWGTAWNFLPMQFDSKV